MPDFTPGPWKTNSVYVITSSAPFRMLFDCKPLRMTLPQEECLANARLIAEAPAMYDELNKAHRFLRKTGYDMTAINGILKRINSKH